MYYLNSRYYNPEWGRFTNADAVGILKMIQGQLGVVIYLFIA
nr:hypothetical protein [Clostridium tunisiense]